MWTLSLIEPISVRLKVACARSDGIEFTRRGLFSISRDRMMSKQQAAIFHRIAPIAIGLLPFRLQCNAKPAMLLPLSHSGH
jgi:hypothetical protein